MNTEVRSKKVAKEKVAKEVEDLSCNQVHLCGRVSGLPIERELPSGDKVVEFRLVISRESRVGVDTLDIGAWSAKARRRSVTLKEGEWIEITGAVHRRFWQAPQGVASRWQIEASEITRI